ncbi:aldo/keto reductase [Clostridium paraputrificum]|uniref:aldo/keto reductase n=1 Tax=Clostridium paraputrificum TaxID=29363 RepID=UPI00232D49ED|nr:aldo/keto reductase [Clostridium paraputrificum]MDB2107215.1 aldo/keto reductase [Clostridium paraputrificum]MDB2113772.1 aldo/keto reductase [Clostridium paraputrificum]
MKKIFYLLNNNYKMPNIGFGTFRTPSGEETEQSVLNAIKAGYRHIDCAAAYGNEKSVGESIRKSGVAREEIFVTSKLWNDDKGYENTLAAFNRTLEDLQLEYLDLYLIHWPIAKASKENWKEANSESWRALEELYNQGKIKAIGVSNFLEHHLEPLFETAKIKPMVNQIEFHPGMLQKEIVEFCKKHNILVEAWAPFSNGQVLNNPVLKEIADKYEKTVAQLTLRWIIQKGIVPLPKSVTPERIKSNLEVFDFEISAQDVERIDRLTDCGGSGLHPDEVDF